MHREVGFNWVEQAVYELDEENNTDICKVAEIVSELIDQCTPLHPWRDKLDQIWVLLDAKYTRRGIVARSDETRDKALFLIQDMYEDMIELQNEINRLVDDSNKEIQDISKKCREKGVQIRTKKIKSKYYWE